MLAGPFAASGGIRKFTWYPSTVPGRPTALSTSAASPLTVTSTGVLWSIHTGFRRSVWLVRKKERLTRSVPPVCKLRTHIPLPVDTTDTLPITFEPNSAICLRLKHFSATPARRRSSSKHRAGPHTRLRIALRYRKKPRRARIPPSEPNSAAEPGTTLTITLSRRQNLARHKRLTETPP